MNVSMKKIVRQVSLAAMAGTVLTVFSSTNLFIPSVNQAVAAEGTNTPERRTRRTPSMTAGAFKYLERAQLSMDEKDFIAAQEHLEDLRGMRRLNSYEEANLWYLYAYYYFELDDTPNAIQSFERILQLENLPLAFEDNIRYQLAQLKFSEEKYDEALAYLNQWFIYAVDPQASAYQFKGSLHYAMEDYDLALEAILKAIELTELSGGEMRENWYLILKTIYFEQEKYEKVREVLEFLVINFSKPTHWLQLASIHSMLENEAEQLAVMEVAYRQGFLTEASHYKNMALIYMFNEVPIKAAEVMREGFEKNILEEDKSNLEILANSLINAKEFEDSIPPLVAAADLDEDGDLSLRLGQVYMERDQWDLSIEAIKQAIEKGELNREDQTYMLLGMAYFNNDQLTKAKEAFQESRKDRRSRSQSAQWISHITNEMNRRQQLAAAARE